MTFPRFQKSYGKDPKDFKNARGLQEHDFLCMYEHGPFYLDSKEHMGIIAGFIQAYTSHVAKQQAPKGL